MGVNGIYVNAHLQVFINGVPFHDDEGDNPLLNVISAETHNDGNHIGSYAEIIMPQTARIAYISNPDQIPTQTNPNPNVIYDQANNNYVIQNVRTYFNTGDSIVIKAKYEGYENDPGADSTGYLPIFTGFLYDFYETTPLKVKCLDYIYWFNIGIYGQKITTIPPGNLPAPTTGEGNGVSFPSISFKNILTDLIKSVNYTIANWNNDNGTKYDLVTLQEPIFDMDLVNISFTQMSPAAVLEWFKKEIGLNISLMGTSIYVNIASNTLKTVILNTQVNVIASNLQTTNLQKTKKHKGSASVFLRIKLKCYFIKNNGTKDSFEIGDDGGQLRECFFYNVTPGANTNYNGQSVPSNYLTMAQNAIQKYYHDRYTGEVEMLLYPYCDLFWKVQYFDYRFPERNSDYVITMIKRSFNDNGFRTHIKLAFLDNPTV